jgi:hypothetical protein
VNRILFDPIDDAPSGLTDADMAPLRPLQSALFASALDLARSMAAQVPVVDRKACAEAHADAASLCGLWWWRTVDGDATARAVADAPVPVDPLAWAYVSGYTRAAAHGAAALAGVLEQGARLLAQLGREAGPAERGVLALISRGSPVEEHHRTMILADALRAELRARGRTP